MQLSIGIITINRSDQHFDALENCGYQVCRSR